MAAGGYQPSKKGARAYNFVLHLLHQWQCSGKVFLPVRVCVHFFPPRGTIGNVLVAPQMHDLIEFTDIHRHVPADTITEIFLLQWETLLFVESQELRQFAGNQRIGAVIDNHGNAPVLESIQTVYGLIALHSNLAGKLLV